MLTSLRLRNYKSWADTGELRLAPITGLFGTNSSGKSSILQLLLVMKQTVESSDRAQVLQLGGERALVDAGTFREVVHNHQAPGSIELGLTWSLPQPLDIPTPGRPRAPRVTADKVRFKARIGETSAKRTAQLVVEWFDYCLSDSPGPKRSFGMRRHADGSDHYDLVAAGFRYKRFRGRPSSLPAPVKFYGFPDQVYASYQNVGFLAELQLAFENLFSNIYYLGPLREYPQRQYVWAGTRPSDVGQRGEQAIAALLAARDRRHRVPRGRGRRYRPLDWMVAYWLKELGLIHSFEVEPVAEGSNLYRVLVQRAPGAAKVLITDVGFGISQVLPVLVLCYYVPEGATLILEQPEIHLHPSVQAGLADVLIDAVKTRGIQVILESHSEHLLRRLQRRIAEAELAASDTALYFCQLDRKASKIMPLEVDSYGNIVNWPPDFFGDELGELAAMTEAAMRRRMAEAS